MKAEIRDTDKNVVRSLRMLGFNIGSVEMETILNVYEFVKEKGDKTTLMDLSELEHCVQELFKP